MIRELCGGGLIQLPSSVDDFKSAETAPVLERLRASPPGSPPKSG